MHERVVHASRYAAGVFALEGADAACVAETPVYKGRVRLRLCAAERGNPTKEIIMNSRDVGLRVASAVFGVMCLGQLVRLVTRLHVMVGSHAVPVWCSGVVLVVVGALSIWLWRLSLGSSQPASAPPA